MKDREGELNFDSFVLLNQIRSIDRRRLVKRMSKLRTDTMTRVDNALQISLGMVVL